MFAELRALAFVLQSVVAKRKGKATMYANVRFKQKSKSIYTTRLLLIQTCFFTRFMFGRNSSNVCEHVCVCVFLCLIH